MFENEIITQGERIRKYRTSIFGVKQDEVAKGVCTKIWLSQIENNRKKLTLTLATGIAKNFNEIAKKEGINLSSITAEELMKDEDEQANDIFTNNIIKKLKQIKEINIFDQKLREGQELIERYNIRDDRKIELYKLAAHFYYYEYKYEKSEAMCELGLKISIKAQNILHEIRFYIYKARNNMFMEKYDKALQQLSYAEKLNIDISNSELLTMILFYRATTYKRLGDYSSALKYFEEAKKFGIKDINMLLKVKMNYANCLNDYNRLEEAEKEYNEIINIAMKHDNKNAIGRTYRNLSELYANKKNYKLASMYIKQCLSYNPCHKDITEYIYYSAEIFRNSNEETDIYLLKGLEICIKDGDSVLAEKIIYELALIYIKKEDKENLRLIVNKAKELDIDYSLIYLEIGEYYRGRDERKSRYFSRKALEKIKNIKDIF